MYFPHLISGPIIRFSELWHQYKDGLASILAIALRKAWSCLY